MSGPHQVGLGALIIGAALLSVPFVTADVTSPKVRAISDALWLPAFVTGWVLAGFGATLMQR